MRHVPRKLVVMLRRFVRSAMTQLCRQPADFEAIINILSTEAGGRINPPFNGIRWDFAYAADGETGSLFMIWPDFFDDRSPSASIFQHA